MQIWWMHGCIYNNNNIAVQGNHMHVKKAVLTGNYSDNAFLLIGGFLLDLNLYNMRFESFKHYFSPL